MVGSVYVGDLLPTVTENELFGIFQAAGQVASVRVCRDHATRRSLGYAYVNFQSAEDGEKAIQMLNCSLISNRPCRVMPIRRDPLIRKGQAGNVFIRGLAKSIDSKALLDTFSTFGRVTSCKVKTNRKGESMGFGYIQYAQESDAESAIAKANGMLLKGETIELTKFKLRTQRIQESDNEKSNEYDSLPTTVPFLKKTTFDTTSPLVQNGTCLYVKNIGSEVTSAQIQEIFTAAVGKCLAHVKVDRVTGMSREYAIVYVPDLETAQKAMERLNGVEKFGKPLYVTLAQRKEVRRALLLEKDRTMRSRLINSHPVVTNSSNTNPPTSSPSTFASSAPLLHTRPAPVAPYIPYSPQLAAYMPSMDSAYSGLVPGFSSPSLAGMSYASLPGTYSLASNAAFASIPHSPSLGPSGFPLTYRVLHPSAMRGGRGRGRGMGMLPHSMSGMGPFQATAAGPQGDYWKLSPLVMNLYPGCFTFITNRLLAKEHTNVTELLNDPDVLKVKADEAFREMQSSSTWKSEFWNSLCPLVCALRPIDPMSVVTELSKVDVAEGASLLTDSEKLKTRVAELSESLQRRREALVDWSDPQSIAMALYPRIAVTEGPWSSAILQVMLQDKESTREAMKSDEAFDAKIVKIADKLKKETESLPQPQTPNCLYPMNYQLGLPGSPVYYPMPSPLLMPLPPTNHPYLPVLSSIPTPALPSSVSDGVNWTDKQSIGEALYPRIEALVPAQAGKITGMLLELDNDELKALWLSPEALVEKIKEALTVLMEHLPKVDEIDWTQKDSIERALLPRVQAFELMKGAQITTSLLEKDQNEIKNLLQSEDALKEQISKLSGGKISPSSKSSDKVDWTNKQSIGEALFPRVQAIDQERAGRITGMLLERDNDELRRFLTEDTEALNDKIAEALKILKDNDTNAVVV